MNCQHCQPLLLDHLYGLLDGPEALAVDAHLASCPTCAAARAESGRVQGLIARAAKSAFPNTRFEPPAQPAKTTRTPAPASASPVLPFPAPKSPTAKPGRTLGIGTILPWAVAAAVMIAIPGTVVPVLNIFHRAHDTELAARTASLDAQDATSRLESAKIQHETQLSDAQFKVLAAEQNQNTLLNAWVDKQKAAVTAATGRKLTVDVVKPAAVQPGAPNDFLLVVRDSREPWETRDTKMVAEIHATGASDAVLFSQALDHRRHGDKHPLRLPAEVWAKVKPNTELFLVVAAVDEKTGTRTELLDKIQLAGPVFTTLLVTDKPSYRPGERLFFRSLTLDRVTFRPPTREQILKYELVSTTTGRLVEGLSVTGTTDMARVIDGRVEPVRTPDGQPVRGVGCGEFVLPTDLADGEYLLALHEYPHPGGFPATLPLPVTRPVTVRAGAVETYRKQIGFARRASYVPGDTVEAWAELKYQDRLVKGAAVAEVVVEADGTPVNGVKFAPETDNDGRARLNFALPSELEAGDVRLKVTFRTPTGDEAVAKQVPVIGRRLLVEYFPECGDKIVAGVPNKVYVRATTPAGQPVDIRGVITDGKQTLAKVETLHDENQPGVNRGLASFTYTPQLGTRVWLKLDSPVSVHAPIMTDAPVPTAAVALFGSAGAVAARRGFPLPDAQAEGVVMTVPDAVTSPGQAIRVHLHSVGQPRTIVVGAYTRGRLSDTQRVTVEPGQLAEVKLMAGTDPRGGVVRITAFEELEAKEGGEKPDLKPLAERLVFRKPGELLKLTCVPSAAPTGGEAGVQAGAAAPNFGYFAGSGLNLNITATDEKENPAAAILWAAVVNSGVAPGAKDRSMPTHFLLGGEVKNPDDLEYADFLLTDHKNAAEALDLVLGTQGWRRFAEQQPAAIPAYKLHPNIAGADVTNFKFQHGHYATFAEPSVLREHRKLYETYAPRYEAAVKAVAAAKAGLNATLADTSGETKTSELSATADHARHTADEKAQRAEAARGPVLQFRAGVWYGVAGLAALAICCALVSYARPTGRYPLGMSAFGSIGLAAFLVVMAGWSDKAVAGDAQNAPKEMALGDRAERTAAAPPMAPMPNEKSGARPDAMVATPEPVKMAPGGPQRKGDPKGKDGFTGGGGPGGAFPVSLPAPKNPYIWPPYPPRGPGDFGKLPGFPPIYPGMGLGSLPQKPAAPDPPGPIPVPGAMTMEMMKDKGWQPGGARASSVTDAELARSKSLMSTLSERAGRAQDTTEKATALQQASDRVAKFAIERTDALTAPLDQRRRAPFPVPESAVQLPPVEIIAVQRVRATLHAVPPLVVREYAPPRPSAPALADAVDSPDTILWQPVIVLPADGKTTLSFHLGHARGGYELVIAGHTADGRLGAYRDIIPITPAKTVVPGGSIPPVLPVAPAPPPKP